MDVEYFREYCLSKNGVTEGFPFDESTLVFKVMGKMFALTNIDLFESVNLKCDPERAVELRENNSGITPGFHMNKKHWNTITTDELVEDNLLLELVNHSFELVVSGLTKKLKAEFDELSY
jgi:predicted DNA-binding protein (MmcQ/YjbR family)